MFTEICFINKNTEELRDKLVKLGYKYAQSMVKNRNEMLFINQGYFSNNFPYSASVVAEAIGCQGNEELFLALAALREDSDYMQYFVCGDSFVLCDREGWLDMYSVLHSGGKYSIEELDNAYKATVEELIEHFNKKDNEPKDI